ncbi:MAG TPA: four helix bundle protein [Gemmataceae bacterium]|nr:four helix bundle protein [Gemmataceae bacterium]
MAQTPKKPVIDLMDRTFAFAVRVTRCCRTLTKDPVNRILGTQLLRAATSVGAMVEEARAGESRKDFISKNAIALKEARETNYWLRLVAASDPKLANRLQDLIQESKEIRDILGAVVRTARRNSSKQ